MIKMDATGQKGMKGVEVSEDSRIWCFLSANFLLENVALRSRAFTFNLCGWKWMDGLLIVIATKSDDDGNVQVSQSQGWTGIWIYIAYQIGYSGIDWKKCNTISCTLSERSWDQQQPTDNTLEPTVAWTVPRSFHKLSTITQTSITGTSKKNEAIKEGSTFVFCQDQGTWGT